jgi:hypothetical protein
MVFIGAVREAWTPVPGNGVWNPEATTLHLGCAPDTKAYVAKPFIEIATPDASHLLALERPL